jgi:hypothetical protein
MFRVNGASSGLLNSRLAGLKKSRRDCAGPVVQLLSIRASGAGFNDFDPLGWDRPPAYSPPSQECTRVSVTPPPEMQASFHESRRPTERQKFALMAWRWCPDQLDASLTAIVLQHLLVESAGALEIVAGARVRLIPQESTGCIEERCLELGFDFKREGAVQTQARKRDTAAGSAQACADAILAELERRLGVDRQIVTQASSAETSRLRYANGTRSDMVHWHGLRVSLQALPQARIGAVLRSLQAISASAYDRMALMEAGLADVWALQLIELAGTARGAGISASTLAHWRRTYAYSCLRAVILCRHAPSPS